MKTWKLFVVLVMAVSPTFAQLPLMPVVDTSNAGKAPAGGSASKVSAELQASATEMLQQVGYEAGALRLPENRAYIYATVGDILWKTDEKQARKLFRDAASEIVNANNVPHDRAQEAGLIMPDLGRPEITNLRRMVLLTLASHDGPMALELLVYTRPPDLAAAMQNSVGQPQQQSAQGQPGRQGPQAARGAMSATDYANNYKVQQELQLEQSIIRKVSEQDPEQAAKLIRDSWSKGFTIELMGLLQQMAGKDPKLANSLMAETVGKMASFDYTNRNTDLSVAAAFLRTFGMPSPNASGSQSGLKLDAGLARDLAIRLADTVTRTTTNPGMLNMLMPVFERLLPDRIAQIRASQSATRRPGPAGNTVAGVATTARTATGTFAVSSSGSGSGPVTAIALNNNIPSSLSDPNATPEALVSDASNINPVMRRAMYQRAISKSLETGDTEKIRSLLQNAPEGKERDAAIDQLNSTLAMRSLAAGKLDDARRIVDQMQPGNAKVQQLVNIALAARKLNTKESKDLSTQLMDQAKGMVSDFPEDKEEMEGAMTIIAGYATIDSDRAFALLPGVIDEANTVIDAFAILAKYNKQDNTFRDGEMIMSSGSGNGLFRYGAQIKMLAQTDFPRTMTLINQFRRDDIRLFARLFVAQGILKDRIGLDGGVNF